ncbi:MAG: hypothetical protein M5U07_03160 [Xanthobacteraceae bacterium]|nr:hypothetical protein [Xanthobacteraceae bacterium]
MEREQPRSARIALGEIVQHRAQQPEAVGGLDQRQRMALGVGWCVSPDEVQIARPQLAQSRELHGEEFADILAEITQDPARGMMKLGREAAQASQQARQVAGCVSDPKPSVADSPAR